MFARTAPMSPAEFVRAEQDDIVAIWGERSRALAHARRLPGLVLLDHLPDMLEALAQRMEGTSAPLALEATALDHAVDRCRHGVPLQEVVSEYAILRDVIATRYEQRNGGALPPSFGRAFDDAVGETIELYKRAGADSALQQPLGGMRS